jgi:hypothetical protein
LGQAQIDCGLFIHRQAQEATIEACVQEAVSANTDWVAIYGADAEAWHDRVDQASVETRRRKRVGDGSPMTAWFEDIESFDQFDISTCYGAGPVLLIVVGFPGRCRSHVEALARHFRADFAVERIAAGGARLQIQARGVHRHPSPLR